MNAEIISVGTEIILGDIQNTHAQFLSQELAVLGMNVYYHTAVGDNDKRFSRILQTAIDRSDVIFLTGGLGPTTDDITKEVACELLGIECTRNEAVAERIKSYFKRSGRTMTQNNLKQALVPNGAVILDNDWGTAPGFILSKNDTTIVLLPGPPRELRPMFTERVKPYFLAEAEKPIVSKNVRIFGVGESALESQIEDLVKSQNPTVALYAKDGEVLVRVTAKAKTKQQAGELNDTMIDTLRARLGDLIYGIDKDSLQEVVVEQLSKAGQTIAVAESCTGGKLGAWITEISGASTVFEMGLVTYANRIKQQELGVCEQTLEQYGAVSEQTAKEMAVGLSKKSGADFNIAITGIAGPTGGTEEKPVGTVFIAVCHNHKVWTKHYEFARNQNEREYIRTLACLNALNMVRLTLEHSAQYESEYDTV